MKTQPDFRKIRELCDIAQKNICEKTGWSSSKYSSMEKNPGKVTVEELLQLADYFHISPNELLGYSSWETNAQLHLDQNLRREQKLLESVENCLEAVANSSECLRKFTANTLEDIHHIGESLMPPVVAVIGMSNCGKTSLINAFLSQSPMLRTSLKRNTSIATYLLHSSLRPAYLTDDVVLFAARDGVYWHPELLTQPQLCQSMICETGDLSLLSRRGNYEDISMDTATAAAVFGDSDLLESVSIVDTPGFDVTRAEEDFDQILYTAMNHADLVLYCHPSMSVLKGSEIALISGLMGTQDHCPPALRIVATKADMISEQELEENMRESIDRLSQATGLPETRIRELYTPMSIKDSQWNTSLTEKLSSVLSEIIRAKSVQCYQLMKTVLSGARERLEEFHNNSLAANQYLKQLQEQDAVFSSNQTFLHYMQDNLRKKILQQKEICENGFRQDYEKLMSEENLLKILKNEFGGGVKQKDMNMLYAYLSEKISEIASEQINKSMMTIEEDIRSYLKCLGDTACLDVPFSHFNCIQKASQKNAPASTLAAMVGAGILSLRLFPTLTSGFALAYVLSTFAASSPRKLVRQIRISFADIPGEYQKNLNTFWDQLSQTLIQLEQKQHEKLRSAQQNAQAEEVSKITPEESLLWTTALKNAEFFLDSSWNSSGFSTASDPNVVNLT